MEIEKNVPVPEGGRSKIQIINDMDVGDSILCQQYNEAMSLRDALRYRNMKYATRKMEDGYRVWRLS